MIKNSALIFILSILSLLSMPIYAIEINHVYHQPESINTQLHEKTTIHFFLSELADIEISIFDDRDVLIQKITQKGLTKGDHKMTWQGKDTTGKFVPPEAYRYTITARDKNGGLAEHDVSDLTGGQPLTIMDVHWDAVLKQFEYSLKSPTRLILRTGIANNGPLLATVVNWGPRARGKHTEAWDGMDISGVLDLSKHPQLDISAMGFTFSDNTILVTGLKSANKYVYINEHQQKRKVKHQKKKTMFTFPQQAAETRGDYQVKINLLKSNKKTASGLPIIIGEEQVMVSVDKKFSDRALNRRMEPVFFIDGQFVYENEVGFLPMTWLFDTTKINEGEHYLSVNLRGYEGNFGMATMKVYVQHANKTNKKSASIEH